MKKYSLIILFFVLNSNIASAQCELTFDELIKSSVLNSSDYDTFALNKGYTLDAENKTYFCTVSSNYPIKENALRKYAEGTFLYVNYSTHSKSSYIEIKNNLSSMGFKYNGNVNLENTVAYNYSINNVNVTLATETVNTESSYLVVIKIDLSK
jgi:hypothetical protein